MQAIKITEHPLGGLIHWFQKGSRTYSVLGDGYPYADDYELHERVHIPNEDDVNPPPVLPDTELRFATLSDATDWIDTQEG